MSEIEDNIIDIIINTSGGYISIGTGVTNKEIN
jgi:hypothetical protein